MDYSLRRTNSANGMFKLETKELQIKYVAESRGTVKKETRRY